MTYIPSLAGAQPSHHVLVKDIRLCQRREAVFMDGKSGRRLAEPCLPSYLLAKVSHLGFRQTDRKTDASILEL